MLIKIIIHNSVGEGRDLQDQLDGIYDNIVKGNVHAVRIRKFIKVENIRLVCLLD